MNYYYYKWCVINLLGRIVASLFVLCQVFDL